MANNTKKGGYKGAGVGDEGKQNQDTTLVEGVKPKDPKAEKKKEPESVEMKPVVFDEDKGEKGKFLKQVVAEYKFSSKEIDKDIMTNLKRLKLYNNQKRDEEFLGEPLLYTHLNTWLATLYDDKFEQQFAPRAENDILIAENLTDVATYDYELMNKAEIDYDKEWDLIFFSYGLVDMIEFDPILNVPAPSILDPLCFYYDTLASSIDGNVRGRGGMRFLGWDMYLNAREVKASPLLGEEFLDDLKANWDQGDFRKSKARKERLEAMGGTYQHIGDDDLGDNTIYEAIHWRTYWGGEKVITILTADKKQCLGAWYIPKAEGSPHTSWFVNYTHYSRNPHLFRGTSLPDLVEDKQRHKAQLANDNLRLARATVFGSYAYNKNMVGNDLDLSFGYDKWFPVDGDPRTAFAPIQKDVPYTALLDNMLNYMDVSAQKASATPELQQGVLSDTARTLGELDLVAKKTETRYSLVAKAVARGEKDFWRLWYLSYKIHYKEGLGEKVVRLTGGLKGFRKLNRKDIICSIDPDIIVTSRVLEEAEKQKGFGMFAKLLELLFQDPTSDKRAGLKHAMYLASISQNTIDSILPPTSDELIAMEENKLMDDGKQADFKENDNDSVHISTHLRANEGKIRDNHIKAHIESMILKQENPDLQPPPEEEVGSQVGETLPAPVPSAQRATPTATSAPTPSERAGSSNNLRPR